MRVVENNLNKRLLISFVLWVLVFLGLTPYVGFDIDILYALTFFGLILFVIYRLSDQINDIFVGEQFRLVQNVLKSRVATYWLLTTAKRFSMQRLILVDQILAELYNYQTIISVYSTNIEQLRENIAETVVRHSQISLLLAISHFNVWGRLSFNVNGVSNTFYQALFGSRTKKRALVVHFVHLLSVR